MNRANVSPRLVAWARRRSGLSAEALAGKLNVKPEAVHGWESGERRPTFRQAQRFARASRVPFGYLFLSAPPEQGLPIPDFRTVAGQPPTEPSTDFLDLLDDVLTKQQWFREHLEAQGAGPVPFIGRYGVDDDVDEIAADIGGALEVDDRLRDDSASSDDFLRELVLRTEALGIPVLRSGVVGNNNSRQLDVGEFRGFAIGDDLAPLIFINGRDHKPAQIFTLAHELTHLWLGETGVSNPDLRPATSVSGHRVEQVSNRVAAEVLVPSEDLVHRWRDGPASIDANLRFLTSHYRVSAMAVLRHAHDLALVSSQDYWAHYDRLASRTTEANPSGDSGGNFHFTLLARNSSTLVRAVISSVAEGSLLFNEAARLLNVRVSTLPAISEHLFGNRLSLA